MRGPAHAFFTRLTSKDADPTNRLVHYLEQLPEALSSFDTLPLSAFAFACTGSSYLLGLEREEAICDALIQQHRIPIVTATQAIRRELEGRGASNIALFAPYSDALCQRAADYWQSIGFDVVAIERIDTGPDTRGIYRITDADVTEALRAFQPQDADVILLSGTGMPTISALLSDTRSMVSSNLCLATEVLRRVQCWPASEAANIQMLCEQE